MRALIFVLAVASGGCFCWENDAACVQSTGACYDLPTRECYDGDPVSDGRACAATRLDGTCAEHGYTVRCGDYAVAPTASCGPRG